MVSSSGFTRPAQEKAILLDAIPIDTSEGDKNFRELLERVAYIRGVRVQAIVFVNDSAISLDAKLQIGDSLVTVDEQIQVLLKNERFKEIMINAGSNDKPGIVAEIGSSFSIDGKASREGQILKVVIFTDPIPDIPVSLSTIKYQGVEYTYGEVGNNPNYFVMDMDGELVGHEGNAYR